MLYNQGSQRIEVIVRKESGAPNEKGAREEEATTTPNEQGKDNTNGDKGGGRGISNKKQRRMIITNATHMLAVGRQISNLAINYTLTGTGYKTGDQAYQDRVQRQFEQITDVASLASSAAMGAIYGAWGGPVGSLLGVIFNTASTAASLSFKYAGREREYDVKMFKENNAIEYNRAIAGINLTNGRLR